MEKMPVVLWFRFWSGEKESECNYGKEEGDFRAQWRR